MRHQFVYTLVTVFSLVLLGGCRENKDTDLQLEEQAISELYNELISFENANGFDCSTKGFWSNLAKTAAWDAPPLLLNIPLPGMGYFISGVVSMFAAIFIFEEPELSINSTSTLLLAEDAPTLNPVGIEHNECLSEIVLHAPNLIHETPQGMINTAISVYKDNNPECPFSDYIELKTVFPLIDDILSCSTEQELLCLCRQNVTSSGLVDIAEQLIETISTISDLADLSEYSESVQSIIDASSVSQANKIKLQEVLSVASYSKALWDENL